MSDQPIEPQPEGQSVTLADLLDLTVFTEEDIQRAVDWWNEYASDGWVGVLEE